MTRLPALILASALSLAAAPGPASAAAEPLSGRVLDLGLEPVSGATVELVPLPAGWEASLGPESVPHEPEAVARARTGADGAFAFEAEGLPAGLFALRASAEGFATLIFDEERVLVPGRALPTGLELVLSRALPHDVLVLDPQGRPAAGVSVSVEARAVFGGALRRGTTDARGRLRFEDLPAGAALRWTARDGAGGFAFEEGWSPLEPERPSRPAVLLLMPTVTRSGRLLRAGAEGPQPVAGAPVVALAPLRGRWGWGRRSWRPDSNDHAEVGRTVTGGDGSWSLSMPATATAVLAAPGLPLQALEGGPLLVGSRRPWSGRVLDGGGRPVAGAFVRAPGTPWSDRTGEQGRWRLPAPAEARRPVLEVLVPGEALPRAGGAHARTVIGGGRMLRGRVHRAEPGPDGRLLPGAAVAGATVRAKLERLVIVTATGEDGSFEMGGLPARPDALAVEHGELVAGLLRPPTHEPLELVVAPRPGLRGLVVGPEGPEGEPGAPVAGALVVLRPADQAAAAARPRLLRADGSGRFHARGGLADGSWAAVPAAGSRGGRGPREVSLPRESEWKVEAAGVLRLEVTCRDESGRALEGVRVAASSESALRGFIPRGQEASASTGRDGTARLSPRREVRVRVRAVAPGRAPVEVSVDPPPDADGPVPVELVLPRAGSLAGRVLDARGEPVAGAGFALGPIDEEGGGDDRSRLRRLIEVPLTAADGSFEIGALAAGRWSLKAGAAGHLASEPVIVDVLPGERLSGLELRLGRGEPLRGRVLDPAGAPAAGATVKLRVPEGSRGRYAPPGVPEAVTDPAGRFELAALVPGEEVTVHAERDGDRSPPRVVRPGEEVELRLVALAGLEGSVTLDGAPVEARVNCQGPGGRRTSASSDAEGRWELTELQPGVWNCEARSGEHRAFAEAGPFELAAGQRRTVELELEPGLQLVVRVTDGATGRPLEGAWVRVENASGRETTNELGEAELALRPGPGEARLRAGKEGHEVQTRQLASPWPARVELELEPSRTVEVTGRLLRPDGSPAVGQTVQAAPSGWSRTDVDGRFEVQAEPERELRLSASVTEEGRLLQAELELAVGTEPVTGLELRLEPQPVGGLRLRVTEGGEPAAGAVVRLVHPPSASRRRGNAAADGMYRQEALLAGRWEVRLGAAGENVPRPAGELEIEEGRTTEASLEIPGGAWIEGRVTRSGAPVEAARIHHEAPVSDSLSTGPSWVSWRRERIEAVSRPDGSFRLGPLPPAPDEGRLVIVEPPEPRLPGDVPELRRLLPASQQRLDADVAGGRIAGTVTAAGSPVAGASVEVLPDGPPDGTEQTLVWGGGTSTHLRGQLPRALSDEQGRFELLGLEPGRSWLVQASAEGRQPAVERARTGVSALQLELGTGPGLRGTVRLEGAPSAAAFQLQLVAPDGRRLPDLRVATEGDGSFEAAADPAVPWSWRASSWELGFAVGRHEPGRPLEVDFSGMGTLRLRLEDAAGEEVGATLRLLAFDGRPADGVLVLDPFGSGFGGTRLPGGGLEWARMTAGRYEIEAEHEGAVRRVEVVVEAGGIAERTVVFD